MTTNIVVLGAGNVASNFIDAIKSTDIKILQIYNRHLEGAQILAERVNSEAIDDLKMINTNADAYFFMLSDTGIMELALQIGEIKGILVHTAGSIPKEVFKNKTENYGVFYPFQTFSKEMQVSFSKIPVFIEGSNEYTSNYLRFIAQKLGSNIHEAGEEKRKYIHLSGVFACNFMNHCIYLGEKILKDNSIDKEILKPLLEQSFRKVLNIGAERSQTGPAKRMDNSVIEKHMELLKSDELMYDIYRTLTESICKTYNNNHGF